MTELEVVGFTSLRSIPKEGTDLTVIGFAFNGTIFVHTAEFSGIFATGPHGLAQPCRKDIGIRLASQSNTLDGIATLPLYPTERLVVL